MPHFHSNVSFLLLLLLFDNKAPRKLLSHLIFRRIFYTSFWGGTMTLRRKHKIHNQTIPIQSINQNQSNKQIKLMSQITQSSRLRLHPTRRKPKSKRKAKSMSRRMPRVLPSRPKSIVCSTSSSTRSTKTRTSF